MKVAIFGGSGFIGKNLSRELAAAGDEVLIVSRREREATDGVKYATWRDAEEMPGIFENFDAFVNLAGESINQRWTDKAKERILQSRLKATKAVAALVDRLEHKPEVVVNGSGMSIYGYSDTETFDEDSQNRLTDLLARTVDAWEREADKISGVRLVKLRIGLVLGANGGAFPLMTLPYKLFIGGKVGSGKQWHSWIHINDMTGIIRYAIGHRHVTGPVNCTAPNPVTNDEFGRTVAKSLGKPHWMPVPTLMLKLVLGEMSEVLLDGQRVLPKRMLDYGYTFQFPTLQEALMELRRG